MTWWDDISASFAAMAAKERRQRQVAERTAAYKANTPAREQDRYERELAKTHKTARIRMAKRSPSVIRRTLDAPDEMMRDVWLCFELGSDTVKVVRKRKITP